MTCKTTRELAQHFLGRTVTPDHTDEQLLALLSRYFHVHLALRGANLIVVAHPTPGQTATNLKFPVAPKRLEDAAHEIRTQASVAVPRMGVGFTTLSNGQQAIQLTGNYAALAQLREQLNAALDHHDFDFEPFTYWRTDGNGQTGLSLKFLPDKTLPALDPLPTPKVPRPKKTQAA